MICQDKKHIDLQFLLILGANKFMSMCLIRRNGITAKNTKSKNK